MWITGGFVCFFFLQKVKVNHTNCLHLHNVSDKGKQIRHSKHVCQTHFTFWKEKKKKKNLNYCGQQVQIRIRDIQY